MSRFLLCLVFLCLPLHNIYAESSHSSVQVAFSPNGGATEAITQLIGEAKQSIRVAAYSFTSKEIAGALLEAHKRGVDVRVVLDKSNATAKYSSATFLANLGIPIRLNYQYAIMHNKFIIVDGKTTQTGSFNYSSAAEKKNAENVLILSDQLGLAQTYTREWQRLWEEAKPYASRY